MLRKIGLSGGVGVVFVILGIAVIGYVDPLLAAGVLAILVGLVLVLRDLVTSVLMSFGLGGGF